ncbi:sulfotransferase family 2 domain-containing protein [Psychroserpens sp. SPM9]|uniref:sulfotransferase family 2 domain-containing protein n=1 Tax=Psychroserpens sp. SPM9 TaxID=2975598 RepID=UPI0021A760A7|nr:sulfotransferase family 2 domain-containing protein [Psychroserpens sp. SPM9]MDG5492248.1 sulfotransferase family 2 domain-containing protein [Psychroserpens sp. SPM9]
MIITKDFVVLNLPKTGSTFTRNVLKTLYKVDKRSIFEKALYKFHIVTPKFQELILPNIKMPNRRPDQHGTYSQIPQQYLNRVIVSTIRDPYSRFLSTYKFKAWANPNQLEVPKSILDVHFPSFPDLNMDDYVDLNKHAEKIRINTIDEALNNLDIGTQTIQFVQMFFKDPKVALSKLNDDYINSGAFKADMGEMKFLRQEHLNDDLIQFLLNHGFDKSDIDFINHKKKLNITDYNVDDVNKLWTQKGIDYVSYRERYLLQMLNHFGVTYKAPKLQNL